MYRVTGAELASAGVGLKTIDPNTLKLYRAEREVSIWTTGAEHDLSLVFYGQATDSPYSAFSVYWLTWGGEPGKRMATQPVATSSGLSIESFPDSLHLTRPTLFVPHPGDPSQSWFWQALTAPTTVTVPITLTNSIPAPGSAVIGLWGVSEDTMSPDHHVRVWFDDRQVGDEAWDGPGDHPITVTLPIESMRTPAHTLRVSAVGDTGAVADVTLLRSVDMNFARAFVAEQDRLRFRGEKASYRIAGFGSAGAELYDVSNPHNPIRAAGVEHANGTVTFAQENAGPADWFAVGPSGYSTVSRIEPMSEARPADLARGADYVIITHPNFVTALKPLVEWRAKRGLKVALVTTRDLYDSFGYGAESPEALRQFIRSVEPRFVLLVGKASYDYRDYLNSPNKNLVPTFLIETPHLAQAASDNRFIEGADGKPTNVAIGRIPAKTPDQVRQAVEKIIAYESAPRDAGWRHEALFVTDNKEETFSMMADALAGRLGPRIHSTKIDLAASGGDVNVTRAELIQKWNAGARLITYIGHGSIETWAEGPLFSTDNVGDIRNGDRLPVLFTPTCLDGFFYHPVKDSLTEDLLFREGGIIAGVVPTGLSVSDSQSELMNALMIELFSTPAPTLGEALARAKRQVDPTSSLNREVIDTFVLLGDPALQFGDWAPKFGSP